MLCLPPSSTPLVQGARAPPLPSACQAGRWVPMASRLTESSAACHTGCCRVGIAKPLCSLPDGPPGWQESSVPRCPLGRLSASPGWPAPRGTLAQCCGNLEGFSAAGPGRTSRCLPGQAPWSGKAVSSGRRHPISGTAALWCCPSAAASSRVPPRQAHLSPLAEDSGRALQAGRQLRSPASFWGGPWALH